MNPKAAFQGSDLDYSLDFPRLKKQILRIFTLMSDNRWRTLSEIARATNDPEGSISAQLRNLRKDYYGNHIIDKRRRGDPKNGLYEYRLVINYGQLTLEI
jgi:hypothetical protein